MIMKKLLLLVAVICTVFVSCSTKTDGYKIYPLSPFNSTVTFGKEHDISSDLTTSIRTQYYIVDEDIEYNDRGKLRLQDYIEKELQSDIHSYKAIYFVFYRGTFTFSKNSNQSKQELEDNHAKEKLAEFEYKDGQRYNFDFFKNGSYYDPPRE